MKSAYLLTQIISFIFIPWVGLGSFYAPPSKTQGDFDSEAVDQLIRSFWEKTGVAGVAVAVRKGEQLLYSKGFGFADVKTQKAMEASTQVRTASVAKVLTATALGKLATDGKLDFDAPLKDYLTDLKEPYASLTTRQIAGHTAGVPHRPSSSKAKNRHYAEVSKMVALLDGESLLFEPGTDYQYSSLAYNLLAALIEAVSGKRFVSYMQEDIFKPLGMKQTFPDDVSKYTDADASMYFFKNGKLVLDKKAQDGSYKLAGAGFRSTALDLAKLMDAYSNGFLSEEVMQAMFKDNTLKDGSHTHVGIGWRLNRAVEDQMTIEHAGSWQGARTVIVYYPKSQLTVSIMINTKCLVFIEETAHLIGQMFLIDSDPEFPPPGSNLGLKLKNFRSDGSVTQHAAVLKFAAQGQGELLIETHSEWLKRNAVFHVSGDHYALSTEYGLMVLKLKTDPAVVGGVYQYQVLGDKHHLRQQPMLSFVGDD